MINMLAFLSILYPYLSIGLILDVLTNDATIDAQSINEYGSIKLQMC